MRSVSGRYYIISFKGQINACLHQIAWTVMVLVASNGHKSWLLPLIQTCSGRFVEVDERLYNIEFQQFECKVLLSPCHGNGN